MEIQDSGLRVGDAERAAMADRLGEHFAAGRIDAAELDERVARALRARTRGDLAVLARDLPQPGQGRVATAARAGVVARRARALWWVTGLAPWAVMAVVFVVIWALTGAGYFWPVWPILGWGMGVASTGVLAYTAPQRFIERRRARGLA